MVDEIFYFDHTNGKISNLTPLITEKYQLSPLPEKLFAGAHSVLCNSGPDLNDIILVFILSLPSASDIENRVAYTLHKTQYVLND